MSELETIGAFARRVGLTPSALRFYDDCGLLAPAVVEPGSGYRRYGREQAARAVLLRRLREAQLPLPCARTVLDGDRADAVDVLRAHLQQLARQYEPARRAVVELLSELEQASGGADGHGDAEADGIRACRVLLAGADLAAAARQVAGFAVLPPAVPVAAHPGLACVRMEVAAEEVTLVASDRVHLAVRTVVPWVVEGAGTAVCVPAAQLQDVAGWISAQHEVGVSVVGDGSVTLAGDGERQQVLTAAAVPYPDWRAVLGRLPRPRARAVLDRRALLGELGAVGEGSVVLRVDPVRGCSTLSVDGAAPVQLLGTCTGEVVVVRYDPRVLAAALAAGVGPDAVLELVAVDQPVVVRSADAGSATTLVMPLRDIDPDVDPTPDPVKGPDSDAVR